MSSFNPHWIGAKHCRDYKIGNITLKSVPDDFVLRVTGFRGGPGLTKGNVDEFVEKCNIEIYYDPRWKVNNEPN